METSVASDLGDPGARLECPGVDCACLWLCTELDVVTLDESWLSVLPLEGKYSLSACVVSLEFKRGVLAEAWEDWRDC